MSSLIVAGLGISLYLFRKGSPWNPIEPMASTDNESVIELETTPAPPTSPVEPLITESAPIPRISNLEANKATIDFSTPQKAFKSTRVICDEMGLPLQKIELVNGVMYFPKDIVCACTYQESQFNNNAVGRNKDPKTGKVWSTDWGLAQVNDTKGWQIGRASCRERV